VWPTSDRAQLHTAARAAVAIGALGLLGLVVTTILLVS
jgi:hypothetical protein